MQDKEVKTKYPIQDIERRTKYPSKKLTPCYKCITYPVCKQIYNGNNGLGCLLHKCSLVSDYIYTHMNKALYLFRIACVKKTFK